MDRELVMILAGYFLFLALALVIAYTVDVDEARIRAQHEKDIIELLMLREKCSGEANHEQ